MTKQSITMEPNSSDSNSNEFYTHQHFHALLASMAGALDEALTAGHGHLFRITPEKDLQKTFRRAFPSEHRQYHNCDCCKTFIYKYGNLVTIGEDGQVRSAVWNEGLIHWKNRGLNPYTAVVQEMRLAVEPAGVKRGTIQGVFYTDDASLGLPEVGGWDHLSLLIPKKWSTSKIIHNRSDLTASQAMAAKLEDYRNLTRALDTMPSNKVKQAVGLLTMSGAARAEKVLHIGQFLHNAFEQTSGKAAALYEKTVWKLVAEGDAGQCCPQGTVFGQLVEDLKMNYTPTMAMQRHNARMAGDKYQRPTAISEGNIDQAEKLIEKLDLGKSLARRFANYIEVDRIWAPWDEKTKGKPSGEAGVFADLRPKAQVKGNQEVLSRTPINMSFAKFQRTILPIAKRIEAALEGHGSYGCMTTAVHADAAPLMAWDRYGSRNPFAWYQYVRGSSASNWGLTTANVYRSTLALTEVLGITMMPPVWHDRNGRWKEFGNRAMFILKGAQDKTNSSLALFPECLQAELHSVRSTIEAYSKARTLAEPATGSDLNHAAGWIMGDNAPLTVKVTTELGTAFYHLDRWE